MKVKSGFSLREVCGEYIIVAQGEENIDFSSIISMNETSAFLWKTFQDKDSFSIDDMAQALLAEYEVDKSTALHDCLQLAARWGKQGLLKVRTCPVYNKKRRLITLSFSPLLRKSRNLNNRKDFSENSSVNNQSNTNRVDRNMR